MQIKANQLSLKGVHYWKGLRESEERETLHIDDH